MASRPARLRPDQGGKPEAAEPKELPPRRCLETRVFFHFAVSPGSFSTEFGESVRVVGSHSALGSWDPAHGVSLETSADIFPCWASASPVLIGLREEVEYKYVIVGSDGHLRAWEEYAGNRVFVASGSEMTVEDDEGLYRSRGASGEPADGDDDDSEADVADSLMRMRTPVLRMDKDQRLAFIRELEGDVATGDNDTTFMMMFQLPMKVVKTGNTFEVVQLQNTYTPMFKELLKAKRRVVCIGWPGIHVKSDKDKIRIEALLIKENCIPVFPPEVLFEQYLLFCTTFLWPVFHDVMLFFQTSNPRSFDEDGWAAYQHVNLLYANEVVKHLHDSDAVWIHDYHLIVVPTFITKRDSMANIGFYLHTPFPSSDSFKSLPVREELLSGMLNADQLGFQFFAYARNFIISAKRIYGLDPAYRAGGFIGMDYNGREIMLKIAHFVYGFKEALAMVKTDLVRRKTEALQVLFAGKTVFACMDRCDGLSGLTPKFRAFKRFLSENPQFKGKAVLVQYLYESIGYEEASALKEFLQSEADAIIEGGEDGAIRIIPNDASCTPDIYLRVEKTEREDRLALYRAAHVLLDTTVKGGLNLMPFEFITAHYDDDDKPAASAWHGLSIVSEFSGCSRVLLGSLRVNPWNTMQLVEACKKAMTMPANERREMFDANYKYTQMYSATQWYDEFLTDLRRARKKEGAHMQTIGFGAKLRAVAMGNSEKMSMEYVLSAYQQSKRRVIFLDNEGTLAADKGHLFREYGAPKGDVSELKGHGTAPSKQVLENLGVLASDESNTVVILSGRDRDKLAEWFGGAPRIGLAAEHGFYYKLPIVTGEEWHCMEQNPDFTWKLTAFELMRQFVKRTQGSFIENKGSALVWMYRDADQHFGSWQAKELSSHLKDLLFGFDTDVIDGNGYVEVKLRHVNKGVTVENMLDSIAKIRGEADFILCIGDDRSDEDMFEAINKLVDPSEMELNTNMRSSYTDGASDDASDERESTPRSKPLTSSFRRKISEGGLAGGMGGGLGSKSRSKINYGGSFMDLSNMCGGTGSDDEVGHRRFFTCTIGQKPSEAKFFLHDVDEVSELIATLASTHRRKTKKLCGPGMKAVHTWAPQRSTALSPTSPNAGHAKIGIEFMPRMPRA